VLAVVFRENKRGGRTLLFRGRTPALGVCFLRIGVHVDPLGYMYKLDKAMTRGSNAHA
jgi:hypothetical protein